MKLYVEKVMKNAASMLEQLNGDLAREQEQVEETEISTDRLNTVLDDLLEELKNHQAPAHPGDHEAPRTRDADPLLPKP